MLDENAHIRAPILYTVILRVEEQCSLTEGDEWPGLGKLMAAAGAMPERLIAFPKAEGLIAAKQPRTRLVRNRYYCAQPAVLCCATV